MLKFYYQVWGSGEQSTRVMMCDEPCIVNSTYMLGVDDFFMDYRLLNWLDYWWATDRYTIRWSNMAMTYGPFIGDFPIKNSIFPLPCLITRWWIIVNFVFLICGMSCGRSDPTATKSLEKEVQEAKVAKVERGLARGSWVNWNHMLGWETLGWITGMGIDPNLRFSHHQFDISECGQWALQLNNHNWIEVPWTSPDLPTRAFFPPWSGK